MKSYSKIAAVAGLLALAGASVASAAASPEVIYVTGSTAYRGQAIQAINVILGGQNSLTTSTTAGPGVTFASAQIPGSTNQGYAAKPTTFTFYGGSIGGTPVTIKASFTGSVGGVIQVSAGKTQYYLPTTDTGSTTLSGTTASTLNYPDPTVSVGGTQNPNDPEVPTITFSDTFQSTTGLIGKVGGVTYKNLSGQDQSGEVGANPFEWVVSNAGNGVITNITDKIVQSLYGNTGVVAESVFLGNGSNTPVFAAGRDFDSGTRITALADSGILAAVGNQVAQYNPIVPGSVTASTPYGNPLISIGGTITEMAITGPVTLNGIHTQQGNGGYHNGPDLAVALGNASAASVTVDNADGNSDADGNSEPYGGSTTTVSSPIFVGYLSTGDANTAKTGATPGAILNYNGVTYSAAAMDDGQYSFWGYEHIYNTVPSTDAAATSFVNSLISNVQTITSTPLSALQVSRTTDGAPITPNAYPYNP